MMKTEIYYLKDNGKMTNLYDYNNKLIKTLIIISCFNSEY